MNENINYKEEKTTTVEGFPEYITKYNNDFYKVEINSETFFVIKEHKYKKFKQIISRSKNANGEIKDDVVQDLLMTESIVFPEVTQEDLDNLKMSEVGKLLKAIQLIYDLENFL